MSGKAALTSVAVFVAIWWGFFFLISHWRFGPDAWSEPEKWVLGGLILTTISVSFAAAIACGAYIDTRRKDK